MKKNIKEIKWKNLYLLPNSNIKNNFHLNTARPLLKNKLLSAYHPVVKKPLAVWAKQLNADIHEIKSLRTKYLHAEKIASLFQQAAFIFQSMEQMKQAKDIFYTQIQAFILGSDKYKEHHLLKYVFPAWMGLIRTDRKQGNIYEAFEKINRLTYENKMYECLHVDTEMKTGIQDSSIIEKIKLYLLTCQYLKLSEFIENNQIYLSLACQDLVNEALVVAYVNSNRMVNACKIFSHAGNSYNVLKLRECEMLIKFHKNNEVIDINRLCSTLMSLNIRSNEMKMKQLVFSLRLIDFMKTMDMIESAGRLANYCLQSALKMNDEGLIGDSLIASYSLSLQDNEKKEIENLMIIHYFNTQYEDTRRKMLQYFPDLKHVEKNENNHEAIFLYENLLTFSF